MRLEMRIAMEIKANKRRRMIMMVAIAVRTTVLIILARLLTMITAATTTLNTRSYLQMVLSAISLQNYSSQHSCL